MSNNEELRAKALADETQYGVGYAFNALLTALASGEESASQVLTNVPKTEYAVGIRALIARNNKLDSEGYMRTEWTPTIEDIRAAWMSHRETYPEVSTETEQTWVAEFDRWLASVSRPEVDMQSVTNVLMAADMEWTNNPKLQLTVHWDTFVATTLFSAFNITMKGE